MKVVENTKPAGKEFKHRCHGNHVSRRMKTELLIQMDGLARSDDLVFVLAVSNLPWTLDAALLRRLEKRIFVPLPNKEARTEMFKTCLPPSRAPNLPYEVRSYLQSLNSKLLRLLYILICNISIETSRENRRIFWI